MTTMFVDLIPTGIPTRNPALDLLRFNQNIVKALDDQKPKPQTIVLTKKELREILIAAENDLIERLFEKNEKGEFVCTECDRPVFHKIYTQADAVNESVNEVMYERNL